MDSGIQLCTSFAESMDIHWGDSGMPVVCHGEARKWMWQPAEENQREKVYLALQARRMSLKREAIIVAGRWHRNRGRAAVQVWDQAYFGGDEAKATRAIAAPLSQHLEI
jgi:hypothetical protein